MIPPEGFKDRKGNFFSGSCRPHRSVLMSKFSWLKDLLNPYSRVPPSSALRFFPRLLKKFESTERNLNEEFPGVTHKHIKSHSNRFMEQGAGDRVATKWQPKPWERSFIGLSDKPIGKAEREATKKEERAVGITWRPDSGTRWTPATSFPLLDYEFPIHPGRVILRWLYQRGHEPCRLQRSELITQEAGIPSIYPFGWKAPSVILIGDACIANDAAVFDNCVLKADQSPIEIGLRSHVLEGCTLTTAPPTPERPNLGSVLIGEDTVVGANCTLNACRIGNSCTIGAGTTIGFGARVDDNAVVGAGSVVEADQYIPAGEVWVGRPARYLRQAGDVDNATAVTENGMLRELHLSYDDHETSHGEVWSQYEEIVDNLETELGRIVGNKNVVGALVSKEFDAKVLKLPQSLIADLMDCVPDDDHPNPQPTVCEQARKHFGTAWDYNRYPEQQPLYTGNYNSPTMATNMN